MRYGLMCGDDGMVFDDGTTASALAEDHYLMTTTTGNAAHVLEWLEEWVQTEWPELRVWCTSVTEQWATARPRRAEGPRRARRSWRRGWRWIRGVLPLHERQGGRRSRA